MRKILTRLIITTVFYIHSASLDIMMQNGDGEKESK